MEKSSQSDLFSPIVRNEALMGPFLLVARLMIASLFVYYVRNFLSGGRAAQSDIPSWVLYALLAFECIGTAMVAVGYKARLAALAMAAYCIGTTLIFDGSKGWAGVFMTHSLKDLAVAAGFLFLYANGPGPLSVDGSQGRSQPASSIQTTGISMGLLLLAGRVMAATLFFYFGNNKIFHNASSRRYMVQHNPAVPVELLNLAILVLIIASVLMAVGYKTRYAALALAGFCLIATALFHAPMGTPAEMDHVFLDVSIAGGLLFLFVHGPGWLSVDARQGLSLPAGQGTEALSAKGL
ncbi:MAG TPA: DoxX family protein [Terriglobales bacterium]|jgi:putative oxidoreductase|nr:DoxX family protein [Terriglobales bacterium]